MSLLRRPKLKLNNQNKWVNQQMVFICHINIY